MDVPSVNRRRLIKSVLRLAILLAIFFVAIPAVANYIGPDRTVTTYTWTRSKCDYAATIPGGSCSLTLYEVPGGCRAASSMGGYFNPAVTACGPAWPGTCGSSLACSISQTGNSIVPCSNGQTGCRSTASTSTYPPATISGSFACALPGSNGWCLGGATLSLSAVEPLSGYSITLIEGTRNGASFACSGAGCSVPLGEGTNDFTYWALSTWGDSSSMGSSSGKLDSQVPILSGSLSGTGGNNGWLLSATLTASASDATSGLAGVSYSLDGGAWTAYSGGVTLGDGTHSVDLSAADVAGNVATASALARVDGTSPSLSLSVPAPDGSNGWFRSTPVTVTASGSDGLSGLAGVSINGGGASFTVSSDGIYNLSAQATDLAGNVANASATLMLDTTAPSLGFSAPSLPASGWYTSPVTISADAADAGSGLASAEISTDGGTSWAGSTTLDDGIHTLSLRAGDLAGNMTSNSAVVGVDSLPPTLDLQVTGTPGDDGWYTTPVGLTALASDPLSGVTSIEHQVDGGGWIAGAAFNLAADGSHTIELQATDVAGNVANASFTVKLATSLPQLTLNAPASFRPSTGQLEVAYSVDAGVSGLADWQLNVENSVGNELTLLASGTDPAIASLSWDGAALAAGNYILALTAADGAGNRLTVRQPLALLAPLSPEPAAPAFVIPLRPPVNLVPVQDTGQSPLPTLTMNSSVPERGQTVLTFESPPAPVIETGTNNMAGGLASDNLLWGAAAAAAIGYSMAMALDEQRKRKQEEAQAAAEAARANREAGAHDQGFESYDAMLEHGRKVAEDAAFQAAVAAWGVAHQGEGSGAGKTQDALLPTTEYWLSQLPPEAQAAFLHAGDAAKGWLMDHAKELDEQYDQQLAAERAEQARQAWEAISPPDQSEAERLAAYKGSPPPIPHGLPPELQSAFVYGSSSAQAWITDHAAEFRAQFEHELQTGRSRQELNAILTGDGPPVGMSVEVWELVVESYNRQAWTAGGPQAWLEQGAPGDYQMWLDGRTEQLESIPGQPARCYADLNKVNGTRTITLIPAGVPVTWSGREFVSETLSGDQITYIEVKWYDEAKQQWQGGWADKSVLRLSVDASVYTVDVRQRIEEGLHPGISTDQGDPAVFAAGGKMLLSDSTVWFYSKPEACGTRTSGFPLESNRFLVWTGRQYSVDGVTYNEVMRYNWNTDRYDTGWANADYLLDYHPAGETIPPKAPGVVVPGEFYPWVQDPQREGEMVRIGHDQFIAIQILGGRIVSGATGGDLKRALCGEFAVAYLGQLSIEDALNMIYQADSDLLAHAFSNVATERDELVSMIELLYQRGTQGFTDPLHRPGGEPAVTPGMMRQQLDDGRGLIMGVKVDQNGSLDQGGSVDHWVTVTDVFRDENAKWHVRVYDPIQNDLAIYDFDTFNDASQMFNHKPGDQVGYSGIWVDAP